MCFILLHRFTVNRIYICAPLNERRHYIILRGEWIGGTCRDFCPACLKHLDQIGCLRLKVTAYAKLIAFERLLGSEFLPEAA